MGEAPEGARAAPAFVPAGLNPKWHRFSSPCCSPRKYFGPEASAEKFKLLHPDFLHYLTAG